MKALAPLFALLAVTVVASPQAPSPEVPAPTIPGVIAAGTRVQVVREGFASVEAPIGLPDGHVLFADENEIRHVNYQDDTVSTFLEGTRASGLALDSTGRLLAVSRRGLNVIHPKERESVLSTSADFRANDLVVDKKGGVYYTVTPVGPPGSMAGVYYVPPGGQAVKVVGDVEYPNGILLSRDERTLYLNNSRGEHLLAFDVQSDGTLNNRRNFAPYAVLGKTPEGDLTSGADGLAIDGDGRLYAAATIAGVYVFSPGGALLGTIQLPRQPQNLAFAGPDKRTLYIVGRGSVFKVRMVAQGFLGRAK